MPTTRLIASPAVALLMGASLWGVVWYPMRLLESQGMSGLWLTLMMYGSALLVSLPFLYRSVKPLWRDPVTAALLMLGAGWTNIAFVEAILHGNVLRVLLLFYLSPIWQVVLGWIVLEERPTRASVLTLGVAMGGAVIMLWDSRSGFPWPSGRADWLALSSGMAFAASNVFVRKAQHLTVESKGLAVWIGVTVLSAIILATNRAALPDAAVLGWVGAGALGILGILSMTLLVQFGVSNMPVHRSAVLALIELVAGAVSQQMLTDEVVVAREIVGGLLIAGGAYYAARRSV